MYFKWLTTCVLFIAATTEATEDFIKAKDALEKTLNLEEANLIVEYKDEAQKLINKINDIIALSTTAKTPEPVSEVPPLATTLTPQEKWQQMLATDNGKEIFFIHKYLSRIKGSLMNYFGSDLIKPNYLSDFFTLLRKTSDTNYTFSAADVALIDSLEEASKKDPIKNWVIRTDKVANLAEILELRDQLKITKEDLEKLPMLLKEFNLLPGLGIEPNKEPFNEMKNNIRRKIANYRATNKYSL